MNMMCDVMPTISEDAGDGAASRAQAAAALGMDLSGGGGDGGGGPDSQVRSGVLLLEMLMFHGPLLKIESIFRTVT